MCFSKSDLYTAPLCLIFFVWIEKFLLLLLWFHLLLLLLLKSLQINRGQLQAFDHIERQRKDGIDGFEGRVVQQRQASNSEIRVKHVGHVVGPIADAALVGILNQVHTEKKIENIRAKPMVSTHVDSWTYIIHIYIYMYWMFTPGRREWIRPAYADWSSAPYSACSARSAPTKNSTPANQKRTIKPMSCGCHVGLWQDEKMRWRDG